MKFERSEAMCSEGTLYRERIWRRPSWLLRGRGRLPWQYGGDQDNSQHPKSIYPLDSRDEGLKRILNQVEYDFFGFAGVDFEVVFDIGQTSAYGSQFRKSRTLDK